MAPSTAAVLLFAVSAFHTVLGQEAEKQGLRCYNCSFGQPCTDTSLVTCKEGERCGTIRGHSDYKVHESILGKGCLSQQKCFSHERIMHSSSPFRVAYFCCNTNRCNQAFSGAPHGPAAPLLALLGATALALLLASLS